MNPQSIELACILKGLKVRPRRAFAAKTANQGESAQGFSGLLEEALTSARGVLSPAAHKATKIPKTGQGWLEYFRNQLLSQGIPLKNLSLSPKALPELKDLLMGEGLSGGEVDHFLERLFRGDSRGEIKITQLFEKLSELRALSEKKSPDPVLEVSVLPHLETALRCLGLDVQQAKKVIDQARADGGGLNLKTFVQKLKQLVSNLPQGTQPSLTERSAEQIKDMLARTGVVDEAGKVNGPVSLERFVQIIEEKLAGLMPHRFSKGQMENQVEGLLGHVLVESEEQDQASSVKAIYAGKLRPFPAQGLRDRPGSRAMGKGSQEMVSTGGLKPAHAQGPQATLTRVAQEMISTGDPAEDSAHAGTKTARFPVEVEKMIRAQGSSDRKGVDQRAETALYAAKEVITDRLHALGAETRQTARTLPPYVVNQVGRQMALGLRRGESQIRLQLRPPHLGSIQLDMDMKDNVLKVGMITEHHTVKELLMSHVHELRESLVEQGVKFERIEIQINYNFGQSMANARRDLNEAHSGRQGLSGASPISGTEGDIAEEAALANMRSNALLDMFA